MNGERGDGEGGAEPEVEDEFACAGMLRGALASMRHTVERIFRVAFGIGTLDLSPSDSGQIWLKLRGPSGNVSAAKLFVKGVVNQEEQQEVSYPEVLHCVFCGARGLFLDSLIRSTSAHIVVGSPGSLLLSGLAEPVVGAYSLISDLVDRYRSAQNRRSEMVGNGSLAESLDSRRAFKTLVEEWEDRHTLDLLVLPSSVKEILLDLVTESGLGSRPTRGSQGGWRDEATPDRRSPSDPWTARFEPDPLFQAGSPAAGTRGMAEGAEERLWLLPQIAGEEKPLEQGTTKGEGVGDELEVLSSMGNKEFWLLLKFFTAMGYTEDVVKRVLARTGPKEASQILDLVQQEQDRSEQDQQSPGLQTLSNEDGDTPGMAGHNRPCESEHTEEEEEELGEARRRLPVVDATEAPDTTQEEDFVFGVLKRAAASCGYAEQNVAKFYNMLPKESTHQLLLELQRETGRETDAFREGPREMDDVVLDDAEPEVEPAGLDATGVRGSPAVKKKVPLAEPNLFGWIDGPERQSVPRTAPPQVKGPPMPTYPSPRDPLLATSDQHQSDDPFWLPPPTAHQSHQTDTNAPKPRSSKLQLGLQAPPPPATRANSPPTTRPRERRTFPAAASVVVTGEQRFLEGLQAPFQLKLTDAPGDPMLRTIIIDASNVAMSHGLGHFFSCRGIALAVQHFWDRGHRHISAMLPQWRQKSDPKIKEQHYLMELQTVGLLSFTPSREVHGKRISSYDDRLMLQLAQKTHGVIVTNDNLRDLSDESPAWRDIIKNRLLQYTFVGDHFMVPDDPLGRGGPHLDDFLRAEHRTPPPGNHSFAGSASTFPFGGPQRSQTELCSFRDRTLGGAVETAGGVRQGKGRGKGPPPARRPLGVADRSAEQTAALREQLCQVFPGQDNMVTLVLQCHPVETDVNVLSDLILEQ